MRYIVIYEAVMDYMFVGPFDSEDECRDWIGTNIDASFQDEAEIKELTPPAEPEETNFEVQFIDHNGERRCFLAWATDYNTAYNKVCDMLAGELPAGGADPRHDWQHVRSDV